METIDLADLNADRIQALIENRVFERKTLEYKQNLTIETDADKKEFLADVSSLANSIGGTIIYGVAEDRSNGTPVEMVGITVSNPDDLQLRLTQLIRDGISPRITGLGIKLITLTDRRYCIAIHIDKSWNPPHRVVFKGHDKFYARSTNGKYPMDVDELRDAFIFSATITERIRQFRESRLFKIQANKTPYPITSSSKVVIHLIPLISFTTRLKIDLQMAAQMQASFRPPLGGGWDGQYTLNGFMTYTTEESYALIDQSGIVEAVNCRITTKGLNDSGIPSILFEKMLIECTRDYLKLQKEVGVTFPIFLFVTLLGVDRTPLHVQKTLWPPSISNTQDVLDLVESRLESFIEDHSSIAIAIKGTIDSLYNAYGYKGSFSYDNQGRWSPR